jgi:peroxiredoxin
MADKLQSGDVLPTLTLQLAGGGEVTLPHDLTTPYGVVLFYRGHW